MLALSEMDNPGPRVQELRNDELKEVSSICVEGREGGRELVKDAKKSDLFLKQSLDVYALDLPGISE